MSRIKPSFLLVRSFLNSFILLGCAAGVGYGQFNNGSQPVTINSVAGATFCADTSGAANTITCSTVQPFPGYLAGQAVDVLLANTVTGATTININGLGALPVTFNGGNALTSAMGWVATATGRLVCKAGTSFEFEGIVSTGGASPGLPDLSGQYRINGSTFGGMGLSWDNTYVNPLSASLFASVDAVSFGGSYTDVTAPGAYFIVTITTAATPDKFEWQKCSPVCGVLSAEVSIPPATCGGGSDPCPVSLSDGVTATFTATTGHNLADSWNGHTGRMFLPSTIFVQSVNNNGQFDPLRFQAAPGTGLSVLFAADSSQSLTQQAASGLRPSWYLRTGRGTLAAPTDSIAGDYMGNWTWQYYYNGAFQFGAGFNAAVDVLGGATHIEAYVGNSEFDINADGGWTSINPSGNKLTWAIPASFSSYAVTVPAGQGIGALTNDGSGGLSWQPSGQTPCTFATLGTVLTGNGQSCYCSDCTITTVVANVVSNATCAGGGGGTIAYQVAGGAKCLYLP